MQHFDRRSLLQGGAAVALATATSGTDALAQAVVQRRAVNNMALNDPILVSYRTAVQAMKNLPAADPRNWAKQASIHDNFCPHRNWYFLPWHRAYLVAFERLCRQLSGNPNFALPYWDWTAGPQLPQAFATPTYNGAPNPLYNATRSSQTVTIPANYVDAARMSSIYGETSFEVFGSSRPTGQNSTAPSWQRANGLTGPLEGTPHNQVHIRIAGDMGTFFSPLDPIFWLHHCNIDRVWDRWNNIGRVNTSDNLWRTFAFNGQFVNPSGAAGTTPYNTTVAGVLNIIPLGYRYTLPLLSIANAVIAKPIDLAKPLISIKMNTEPTARMNVATVARAQLAAPQTLALNNFVNRATAALTAQISSAPTAAKPATLPGRVLAILRDVEAPKEGNADVRVFVNLPDANANTPLGDRHFAGSFTFFGGGHAGHDDKRGFTLDITEVVKNLNLAGVDLAKEMTLQFVPVPIPGVPAAADVKIGNPEIAIF